MSHGLFGHARVSRHHLVLGQREGLLLGMGQPLTQCRLSRDVVARLVAGQQGQRVQRVVLRPDLGVRADLEQAGVMLGKVPAQESLRAHIVRKVGQAFKPAILHVRIQRPAQWLRPIQSTTRRVDAE